MVPAVGICVSGCIHLALPAEIRSSAFSLQLFVTRRSDFLRLFIHYSWRNIQIFFARPSHQLFVTQHSDFLCLLINYSWRNIQMFFAFSSIIRDATFRFSLPSHQLFVTQHSDFLRLLISYLWRNNLIFLSYSWRYILIFLLLTTVRYSWTTFWVVLSFSSVIHDSTYVGITHVPATSLKLSCLTCVNCLKALKLTITFAYLQIQGSVGPTKTVI